MAVHGPWLSSAVTSYLTGATIKAMLVTSAYAENPDQHYRSEITQEVTGTGYTAGGVSVSGVTIFYDSTINQVILTCSAVDFGTVTLADVAGIVFYVSHGSAATDELLVSDLWDTVAFTAANCTYTPSADGLIIGTIAAV